MDIRNYPSRLLERAVEEFAKLPGIGRKTAFRLVLHLLKQDVSQVNGFAEALQQLRNEIRFCERCNNISDTEICSICSDVSRDEATICVVESIKDVIAIENTGQYKGLYHVLGGLISPMDGVGPSDLAIPLLEERLQTESIKEVILALSPTVEGDTTNFYLFRKISRFPLRITTIARGVAIGDQLEYADELTLGRSILHRTEYEMLVKS